MNKLKRAGIIILNNIIWISGIMFMVVGIYQNRNDMILAGMIVLLADEVGKCKAKIQKLEEKLL